MSNKSKQISFMDTDFTSLIFASKFILFFRYVPPNSFNKHIIINT